uniref:Uncharacterized protein n=1 Tax=Anguilla anguilla TaxID=7936 RepID=A0A0E9QD87_ANGAN
MWAKVSQPNVNVNEHLGEKYKWEGDTFQRREQK